jgi:hypothetical protein
VGDANDLNREYWRAVAKSEREADRGATPRAIGDGHTDGLRAVASLARENLLNELEKVAEDQDFTWWPNLMLCRFIRHNREVVTD